jgi:hypothetical protein
MLGSLESFASSATIACSGVSSRDSKELRPKTRDRKLYANSRDGKSAEDLTVSYMEKGTNLVLHSDPHISQGVPWPGRAIWPCEQSVQMYIHNEHEEETFWSTLI